MNLYAIDGDLRPSLERVKLRRVCHFDLSKILFNNLVDCKFKE